MILGSGGSPGQGDGNTLQYSGLGNPLDRGTWRATAHGVSRVGHSLATKPPSPRVYWMAWFSKDGMGRTGLEREREREEEERKREIGSKSMKK